MVGKQMDYVLTLSPALPLSQAFLAKPNSVNAVGAANPPDTKMNSSLVLEEPKASHESFLSDSSNPIPNDLLALWCVFSKCKDRIEDGRRLENISWRLWFSHCRNSFASEPLSKNAQSELDSESRQEFVSGSVDSLETLPEAHVKVESSCNLIENINAISLTLPSLSLNDAAKVFDDAKALSQQSLVANGIPSSNTSSTVHVPPMHPIVKTNLFNISRSQYIAYNNQIRRQKELHRLQLEESRPNPTSINSTTARFYIQEGKSSLSDSNSCDSDLNNHLKTHSDDSESDSDSDGEIELDCGLTFVKQGQVPLRRASLLSVALQRNAFRKSQLLLEQANEGGATPSAKVSDGGLVTSKGKPAM